MSLPSKLLGHYLKLYLLCWGKERLSEVCQASVVAESDSTTHSMVWVAKDLSQCPDVQGGIWTTLGTCSEQVIKVLFLKGPILTFLARKFINKNIWSKCRNLFHFLKLFICPVQVYIWNITLVFIPIPICRYMFVPLLKYRLAKTLFQNYFRLCFFPTWYQSLGCHLSFIFALPTLSRPDTLWPEAFNKCTFKIYLIIVHL